jgi:FkbM family methyltransferase
MEIKLTIPFRCPKEIEPYLRKVFEGEYDIPVHLPPGTKIIDLGANYGSFSLWAAHRWPGSEIIAFEPNPKVFSVLQENISPYPQIKANNWGVGIEGKRALHLGPNNEGESSFHIPEGMKSDEIICEVRDPLTLPPCDILKLDIEGCEMEVLGPIMQAENHPAVILLEYHNHRLRREVDSLLSDYELIGGEVYSLLGLGVAKYLHKEIMKEILRAPLR